jgi:hypothetical protein
MKQKRPKQKPQFLNQSFYFSSDGANQKSGEAKETTFDHKKTKIDHHKLW